MNHYSEHILDLYIRNSDQIIHDRGDIESHLSQCAGCRAVADDLREFYLLAESSKKQLSAHTEQDDALVVQPAYIRSRPLTKIKVPDSLPVRVWQFARRRPITGSVSLFGMAAVILFLIRLITPTENGNPYKIIVNDPLSQIEVYSHEQKFLWSMHWATKEYGSTMEAQWQISNSVVSDIDNDDKNEVLSVIPTLNNTELSNGRVILQVFSSDKKNIFTKELGNVIHYGTDEYFPQFFPRGIIVDDFDGDGKKEIIVGMPHRHSPYILYRLDAQGNVLGEYQHYGHFWGIYNVIIDGRKTIVACGIDDKYDTPVIVVLDPRKIVGTTFSSTHPEFGVTTSTAELYHIALSHSLFDVGEKPKPRVMSKIYETENSITFGVANGVPENGVPFNYLEYTFTKKMQIHDIMVNDRSRRVYERLKKEGKTQENLDDAYLEGLKEKIRYWDGKKWEKEPIKNGGVIADK